MRRGTAAALFAGSSVCSVAAAVCGAAGAGPQPVVALLVAAGSILAIGLVARRTEHPGRHRGRYFGRDDR